MQIKPGLKKEYSEYVAKNQDPYGKGVVDYTERWAALMEKEMEAGKIVKDIWDSTSHAADTEGITGFMYGCAVQAINRFWPHGDDVRREHNIKTQIGKEGEKANETGGVLNPAILNIV